LHHRSLVNVEKGLDDIASGLGCIGFSFIIYVEKQAGVTLRGQVSQNWAEERPYYRRPIYGHGKYSRGIT